MSPPNGNPARVTGRGGAPELVNAGWLDEPEITTPKNQKQDGRFHGPVTLHHASVRVIESIARKFGISTSHAGTITDLSGIGGRSV